MSANEIPKLNCHFNFSFPGKIWKIKPDLLTQNIALEIRQPEMLQAGFSIINVRTGKLLLDNFQTKEPWWTGMEAVHNGVLLLHGYEQSKETGRHVGITAVSETSGQLLWENPVLTFAGLISDEKLLAENTLGQLIELELISGAEEKYSFTKEHAKTQIQAFGNKLSNALQTPLPYLPADAYYPLLQEFIKKQTGRTAIQTIEYLETENQIFLSFYAEVDSVLANFLLVSSAQGEVLLEFCLQQNVTGLGSDTFFIFAEKLFFIQDKTSLACFLL